MEAQKCAKCDFFKYIFLFYFLQNIFLFETHCERTRQLRSAGRSRGCGVWPRLLPAAENTTLSHACCLMQVMSNTSGASRFLAASQFLKNAAAVLVWNLPNSCPAGSHSLTPTEIAPACCLQSSRLPLPPVPQQSADTNTHSLSDRSSCGRHPPTQLSPCGS